MWVKIKRGLRWAAFLPAALAAAMVTPLVVHWCSFAFPIDTETTIGQFVLESMKGAATGAVFVFVGGSIVPSHQRPTALGLSVIGLLASGAGIFANLALHDYMKAWQAVACVIGICAIAQSVLRGETFSEVAG